MYTMGSGCQGNIGPAVHQDPASGIPGKRHRTAGQFEQFPICEILLPNLDEIDRETEKRLDSLQQGFSG